MIVSRAALLSSLVPITLASRAQPPPVRVLIQPDRSHQTIEGFGSCIINFTDSQAFADSAFYDRVVDGLDLKILRISVPPELEAVNDDDDPNHFKWKNFNMHHMERCMRFVQALEKRGVTHFIAAT